MIVETATLFSLIADFLVELKRDAQEGDAASFQEWLVTNAFPSLQAQAEETFKAVVSAKAQNTERYQQIVDQLRSIRGDLSEIVVATDDPLSREIAYRLRNALVAATFPISLTLQALAGDDEHSAFQALLGNPPSTNVSEADILEIVSPFNATLSLPTIHHRAVGPCAPSGITWGDWIKSGLRQCASMCQQTISDFGGRAPKSLLTTLERTKNKMELGTFMIGANNARFVLTSILQSQRAFIDFVNGISN